MNDLQLFDGISAENRAAMMSCFKPEQRSFRRGETIRVSTLSELEQLCLLGFRAGAPLLHGQRRRIHAA